MTSETPTTETKLHHFKVVVKGEEDVEAYGDKITTIIDLLEEPNIEVPMVVTTGVSEVRFFIDSNLDEATLISALAVGMEKAKLDFNEITVEAD